MPYLNITERLPLLELLCHSTGFKIYILLVYKLLPSPKEDTMFNKSKLIEMQQALLAAVPDARVVAGMDTALVIHGVCEGATLARFDVSSGLFCHMAKTPGAVVSGVNGCRMMLLGDYCLREGTESGVIQMNGVQVYSLDRLEWQYNLQASLNQLGSATMRIVAEDIRRFKATNPETALGVLTVDEEAFKDRCKRADWYYSHSDDITVYRAGRAVCEQLEKEATQKGGAYAAIYAQFSKR